MQQVLSFLTVLVVTVCVASAISALYATGLRLFAGATKSRRVRGHRVLRAAGGVCFALCGIIVLFGLWLLIPFFH